MIPRLALIARRSLASGGDLTRDLPTFLSAVKSAGFTGVESSLVELCWSNDVFKQDEAVDMVRSSGLQLHLNISTSNLEKGRWTLHGKPSDHINTFEANLLRISSLGNAVSHVNCKQSGERDWDIAQATQYFEAILPTSAQFLEEHPHIGQYGRETDVMGGSPHHLTGITHETGAKRILSNITLEPQYTLDLNTYSDLIDVLPPIRLSLDIEEMAGERTSKLERKGYEVEAVMQDIIPHVDHIRARFVTDQVYCPKIILSPQLSGLWTAVWNRKAMRGVKQVTITPSVDDGEMYRWHDTVEAANVIWQCFDSWAAGLEKECVKQTK